MQGRSTRVSRVCVFALLATLSWLGTSDSTDAQEPEKVRVAKLIRQLGSKDYRERITANRQLVELGGAGREQLVEALGTSDPEIRLRASKLLQQLESMQIWGTSHVELNVVNRPVSEVIDLLASQTGNHILAGEGYGNFQDKKVTLKLSDSCFWPAMDEICRLSGNHIRPHYSPRRPGLVLVSGPVGKNPVSYSGPVRAKITGARKVFIEQLDYEKDESDVKHTFQINLQMMWEDRFRLVAYRSGPQVVAAQTDVGVKLPSTHPGKGSWNIAGGGVRQLTASLKLHPPPTAAKELKELRLRWGMIAVDDMQVMDVRNLDSRDPQYRDDVQLTVESLEKRSGSRWQICVLIARDLVVPEPSEVLLQENTLELFDSQGQGFRSSGQSAVLTERGARLKMTFQAPSEDAQPELLRLTYPRIRSEHNLEIVFRDVPLPVAKPD